jgi:hypothetical protein
MAFTQQVYKYILEDDTDNLKVVLDSGIPRVILDHLLAFAIKQAKLEAVKILICYCANLETPNYQSNLFKNM